jgi:putative transposase
VKLESGLKEGLDDEAIEVHGRADHCGAARAGAGLSTAEVCRKHGISTATFYAWKAKFGGMEVSEAKRLKQLEDENAKLKRLLADAMLDNAALKDLMTKKF